MKTKLNNKRNFSHNKKKSTNFEYGEILETENYLTESSEKVKINIYH